MHGALNPGDQLFRDLRLDQVSGKAKRDSQDQQNGAHEQSAFLHHTGKIPCDAQVSVYERFHNKGVQRRDGGRFHGRGQAAEQSQAGDNRQQQFPFGAPERAFGLSPLEGVFSPAGILGLCEIPQMLAAITIRIPGRRPPRNI